MINTKSFASILTALYKAEMFNSGEEREMLYFTHYMVTKIAFRFSTFSILTLAADLRFQVTITVNLGTCCPLSTPSGKKKKKWTARAKFLTCGKMEVSFKPLPDWDFLKKVPTDLKKKINSESGI